MLKKIQKWVGRHRLAAVIMALALTGGAYLMYQQIFGDEQETRYVLAQAKEGPLVVSLSGSGQVSAFNQINLKPKVSGEVVYIGVKNGQEVRAGTLIAQLDARDAQKAVRDAEVNLESARIALDKLQLQYNQQRRGDVLNKSYEEGLAVLNNLYNAFATVLEGLNQIFFDTDASVNFGHNNITYYASYNKEFADLPFRIEQLYQETKKLYEQGLKDYQAAERGSGQARAQAIYSGYQLTVKTAEMIKTGYGAVRYLQDYMTLNRGIEHARQAVIDEHARALNEYNVTINGYLNSLLALNNTISGQRDALETYPLDLRSQQLVLRQRENALLDTQEKLADYYIRAPFDGIIAKVEAEKGDSVSINDSVATLITRQKLAEISLNEVDVAKIRLGQKATLTFDAIPELKINGEVAEIDTVGEVSAGVVTYSVDVVFETQDERVKPAMSVTAEIIIESRDKALLIPSAAIKTQRETDYVEMPLTNEARRQATTASAITLTQGLRKQSIKTGISNDEFTEVLSGLKPGDWIVARVVQNNNSGQTTPTRSNAVFRFPGTPSR